MKMSRVVEIVVGDGAQGKVGLKICAFVVMGITQQRTN